MEDIFNACLKDCKLCKNEKKSSKKLQNVYTLIKKKP